MVGLPGLGGGSLGSLIVRIDADTRKLQTGLKQAEGRVQQSSKRMQAFTRTVDNTIRTVNLLGTVFFVTAGLLVKSASDFETAFAGVRKTVDATEDEFFQLSEGIIEMSKRIPVATTELARIQELAGQLGVSGVANLTKFTEVIADIAVTTNLTSEAAATDFARIANIMQLPLDQVDRLGSSIVDLGNNFATTEKEIVNFATRIAGAGKVIGLTTADILGIGAAFSSVGVRAERGGTAVNKALIKIATAVEQGGAELELFAEISGQTTKEFVKGFKEDAAGAFAIFIEGLGRSGLKGVKVLEDLELGDQRLVQSFLSVGGASGILTRAVGKSNTSFEENNALVEEANKRFGTTGSKTTILKNNVTALSISLGEKLLPAFQNILISVNAVVGGFDKLFGQRVGPDTLVKTLTERIELIDQEIEKQREIIQTALGSADARAEAEQRINDLLIFRSRAHLTLLEIQKEGIAQQEELAAVEEERLRTKADTEVGIEAQKEKAIFKTFASFKKKVKTAETLELKELLIKAKVEEVTSKNLEEKKTEILEKELKAREKAEKEGARLSDQIATDSFNLASALIGAIAGESRAAAIALKLIQIAQIVISGQLAIAQIQAQLGVLAPPFVLKQKISTALQVATAIATSFQDGTDSVPEGGGFTHPEEIVIPKNFADAIRDGTLSLSGPGQGRQVQGDAVITNHFQFDNVQLGDDIELSDFTERLGEDVAIKTRSVS